MGKNGVNSFFVGVRPFDLGKNGVNSFFVGVRPFDLVISGHGTTFATVVELVSIHFSDGFGLLVSVASTKGGNWKLNWKLVNWKLVSGNWCQFIFPMALASSFR